LNLSFFIAKRLAFSKSQSFTKVIINIAIAGLAVSIAAMILSGAIISGFKNEINAKILGFWGNIHISDANITRDFDLKPLSINDGFYKKLSEIKFVDLQIPETVLGEPVEGNFKDVRTKGGVEKCHPYIVMPCLVETKSDMVAGLFKGVNASFDWRKMDRFIVEGKGISISDTSNQIVVSRIIANKLKLKVGNKLIVSFIKDRAKLRRAFKVSGIYNTGLEEYDERFIIGEAKILQQILNWSSDQYSGVEVFVDNVEDTDLLNEYIYSNILPSEMYCETIQDKFPNIFEWLKLQDINEKIILLLMAAVAVINLVTVLLILILERTKMVGILKSIGASNWSIRKIFVYYASYILLFGLLIGNVIGLGIAFFQKSTGFIKLDENNYYLDTAPIEINFWNILMINLGAFLLCFLVLLIPSILVSKIKPVQALKFD
jgi:lipoprotein-releasing system permease protein